MRNSRDTEVAQFFYAEIFCMYGVPYEIVTDQGPQFTSILIAQLVKEFETRHKNLTPYHPQFNGQVEVTNKELENILTKIMQVHKRDWVVRLLELV